MPPLAAFGGPSLHRAALPSLPLYVLLSVTLAQEIHTEEFLFTYPLQPLV